MTRQPTPNVLDELFRNQPAASVVQVALDQIDDNPFQPRQSYDQAALEELAASIQSNGLQQPPAGRRMANGRVQLVFGHRRRRAFDVLRAKDAAWSTMPVMIVQASDEDMAARAWTENVERQDLTAVEQAQAIQTMIDSFGWTQADVARRLGLAPATVANKVRLLRSPVEVREAVATGLLSERQAGAMAPLWDLPAPALEAARNRQGYGSVASLVDAARNGMSSDGLRQQVKQVVEMQTERLDNRPWVDVDLGHVARVVASRCTLCQYRILSAGEPRCAGQRSCYQAKATAWEDLQRAELAQATGVKALPAVESQYDSFYGDNKTLAEQHGLNKPQFCERLRVKPSPYGGGLLVDGVEGAELVCVHSGRGCECLERIKKDVSKDGKAQWRLMRQQTVEALVGALMQPTQDTVRLWASMYAPMDKVDQVASWRMEDVAQVIVKALIDRAKPYDAEKRPDETRAAMEAMLRRGNIAAPWSLAAVLAPERSPLDAMRGRARMLRTWITSATGETPLAVDVTRWADDSRAALGELDGLEPGLERDELLRDLDEANQSALEMLDLLAGRYQVSKDVSWICNTPVSDVNARTSLERATRDDLRWCLAVARCQPENKVRMEVIGRRLRKVGEGNGRGMDGGMDGMDGGMDGMDGMDRRPFPSTTSLRDAKRRRLHELLSDEPQQPNGYIAPTVDPNAPETIDAKLQRIAGWIGEFVDPGDGLPTPESVAGNFDNLEKLGKRIAGQPSEADRMKLQAMHAEIYADLAALSDRVQASYDEEIHHA